MKHLFLATLIVVLSVNSSHAQISTILTRLTAQRALTNTNITTKTGSRSITPLNVGYSDDSIMAIMYSLAGLTGAAGDLDAVLTLGNTSDLDVIIDKTGGEGEFRTLHSYNGTTTEHDGTGLPSPYPVTFIGRVGGNNLLYLRDAFGFFGYMGSGTLTADRKVLLPDEGDGVGLDATLVTHTTASPLTVSATGSTGTYSASAMSIDDGLGDVTSMQPTYIQAEITAGTTTNKIKHHPTKLEYKYTNSVGSISKTTYLNFDRSSFTSGTQNLWMPSATNDTLAVKGDITSMGNFATSDLTLTADRTHNFAKYSMVWDSVQHFRINDSLGNAMISNPAAGQNLIQIRHLSGLGSAPSIAAGLGAGTSPTISMGSGSTDLSGYINITTGTTCSAAAIIATITFNMAHDAAPACIMIQPANAVTAALTPNAKHVYVNQAGITTTTFDITAGATALSDATAYQWYYFIVQ